MSRGEIHSPHFACLPGETLKDVTALLPGVYARGSKRLRTAGKCVTCRQLMDCNLKQGWALHNPTTGSGAESHGCLLHLTR